MWLRFWFGEEDEEEHSRGRGSMNRCIKLRLNQRKGRLGYVKNYQCQCQTDLQTHFWVEEWPGEAAFLGRQIGQWCLGCMAGVGKSA